MSGLWQSVATEHLNKGISIGRQEEREDLLKQMIANGEITAAQAAKYQVVN